MGGVGVKGGETLHATSVLCTLWVFGFGDPDAVGQDVPCAGCFGTCETIGTFVVGHLARSRVRRFPHPGPLPEGEGGFGRRYFLGWLFWDLMLCDTLVIGCQLWVLEGGETLRARRRYVQGDVTCKETLRARRRYVQGDVACNVSTCENPAGGPAGFSYAGLFFFYCDLRHSGEDTANDCGVTCGRDDCCWHGHRGCDDCCCGGGD